MEAELAERARRGDLRSTVVRAGDFFGCGQGTWFDQAIVKSLRQGRLVYPGPLDRPHAWAYLPDLAQALVRVASEPEAQDHRRWHFAGHTLTGAELLAQIEAAAGRLGWTPARGWRHGGMPWGLIRLAGRVWPMGRELAEMAYLWERPHALDGRAMAQAFGPLPATPIDQALRQTLLALGFAQRQPLQPAAQH
jgi:nucleoside-diphosphate-sugar epimerase